MYNNSDVLIFLSQLLKFRKYIWTFSLIQILNSKTNAVNSCKSRQQVFLSVPQTYSKTKIFWAPLPTFILLHWHWQPIVTFNHFIRKIIGILSPTQHTSQDLNNYNLGFHGSYAGWWPTFRSDGSEQKRPNAEDCCCCYRSLLVGRKDCDSHEYLGVVTSIPKNEILKRKKLAENKDTWI